MTRTGFLAKYRAYLEDAVAKAGDPEAEKTLSASDGLVGSQRRSAVGRPPRSAL